MYLGKNASSRSRTKLDSGYEGSYQVAHGMHHVVNWIHGDGMVLDDELVGAGRGDLALFDHEVAALLLDDAGGVGHVRASW